MELIRFIGDGDEETNIKYLHLNGAVTDHTLCGDTLDGDTGALGNFEIVIEKKVTCPVCIKIIKHCRRVNI